MKIDHLNRDLRAIVDPHLNWQGNLTTQTLSTQRETIELDIKEVIRQALWETRRERQAKKNVRTLSTRFHPDKQNPLDLPGFTEEEQNWFHQRLGRDCLFRCLSEAHEQKNTPFTYSSADSNANTASDDAGYHYVSKAERETDKRDYYQLYPKGVRFLHRLYTFAPFSYRMSYKVAKQFKKFGGPSDSAMISTLLFLPMFFFMALKNTSKNYTRLERYGPLQYIVKALFFIAYAGTAFFLLVITLVEVFPFATYAVLPLVDIFIFKFLISSLHYHMPGSAGGSTYDDYFHREYGELRTNNPLLDDYFDTILRPLLIVATNPIPHYRNMPLFLKVFFLVTYVPRVAMHLTFAIALVGLEMFEAAALFCISLTEFTFLAIVNLPLIVIDVVSFIANGIVSLIVGAVMGIINGIKSMYEYATKPKPVPESSANPHIDPEQANSGASTAHPDPTQTGGAQGPSADARPGASPHAQSSSAQQGASPSHQRAQSSSAPQRGGAPQSQRRTQSQSSQARPPYPNIHNTHGIPDAPRGRGVSDEEFRELRRTRQQLLLKIFGENSSEENNWTQRFNDRAQKGLNPNPDGPQLTVKQKLDHQIHFLVRIILNFSGQQGQQQLMLKQYCLNHPVPFVSADDTAALPQHLNRALLPSNPTASTAGAGLFGRSGHSSASKSGANLQTTYQSPASQASASDAPPTYQTDASTGQGAPPAYQANASTDQDDPPYHFGRATYGGY